MQLFNLYTVTYQNRQFEPVKMRGVDHSRRTAWMSNIYITTFSLQLMFAEAKNLQQVI